MYEIVGGQYICVPDFKINDEIIFSSSQERSSSIIDFKFYKSTDFYAD